MRRWPRWYRAYFVLAGFDLVTVLLALALSHHMRTSLADSVESNRVWTARVAEYTALSQLASAVNAPGNDVFESLDAQTERRRQQRALSAFDEKLAALRRDLQQNAPPVEAALLARDLDGISAQMQGMVADGNRLFDHVARGEMELAGPRMAAMDRKHEALLDTIRELRLHVDEIRHGELVAQKATADRLGGYERVIAVLVVMMVGAATVYGRRMAAQAALDARLRETQAINERLELEVLERRQAEERLGAEVAVRRRVEHKLAEAQQLAHLGSWEWQFGAPAGSDPVDSEDGQASSVSLATWSAELYRIFGYAPGEIESSYEAFIALVHPDDRRRMRREILRAVKAGETVDSRFRIVRPSGETRYVHARASVERDENGLTAVTGSLLDETEHKHTELQLAETRDVALAASTAKSEFLANMSHEIRTPMNAIIGMAELLAESPLSPEQQEYVRIFRRNGESLLTLINDILDLSKVESGQLQMEHAELDLADVVESTAEVLAVRAHEKGLELLCDVRPEVPLHLVGDAQRLRQVLVNLLGNALKFTERGEVGLRVERDPAAPRAARETAALRFTVWDTGIGIPEEKLDSIFESFTQADATTTRKYGGSGLGLAISKRLVELMGGSLSVRSEAGKGSEFTFTARFGVQAHARPRVTAAPADLQGARVLVVDDNPTNRLILRETLAGQGALISEVASGAEALAAMEQARAAGSPFRLVLLDRRMPGLDGFEVAERLKQDLGTLDTAIIMLTSDRRGNDIAHARRLGMLGYLVKPIRRGDLLATIATAMQQAPQATQTREQAGQQPQAPAVGAGAANGASRASGASGANGASAVDASRPRRILLAEDAEDNRALVQLYLKRQPYELEMVENGREAFERAITGGYDLVLMDVQMPVMDGIAATEAIRAWERQHALRPTPIVALTANAMGSDVQRCLDAGCTGHVAKPVKKQVLLDAIAHYTTTRPESVLA